jgi:hypothetical protein
MASALSALANATATFQVPTTGVYTDPATGNVMPATKDVAISLYLKADQTSQRIFPGVDVQDTIYEGYAISPTAFDAAVTVGTTGTLNFAGEGSLDCEVIALRYNYGKTGLLGELLNSTLGEKVRLVTRRF